MITKEQIKNVEKYVSNKFFDQERMIKYLSLHDVVGFDIFHYVARKICGKDGRELSVLPFLPGTDVEFNFRPQSVDEFIKRLPFLFYYPYYANDEMFEEKRKEMISLYPSPICVVSWYIGKNPFSDIYIHREDVLTMDEVYGHLEYLFYICGYTLEQIFGYINNSSGVQSNEVIPDWFDYIGLCKKLGWKDFLPKKFYYNYNLAREALGITPVIFYVNELDCEAWTRDRDEVKFYKRKANKIKFYGSFPRDDNNVPIMRWIAIDVINGGKIECSDSKDLDCYLTIELNPNTVIKTMIGDYDDIGNEIPNTKKWVQIYAGPQTMVFDHRFLKVRRKELGYTQQCVADAVQTNVRTYQKWERGETTPDGYFLIRILNWLDISDVQQLIKYK